MTTFGLSRGWVRDSVQASDADPGSPLLVLGPGARCEIVDHRGFLEQIVIMIRSN